MAVINFDANAISPQSNFDPIPAGKYTAFIEASEMKPTQDNQGAYLELVHQVADGEFQGRKIWARLNLNNKSKQAVDIAQSQLSSICHAIGIMTPSDSQELHDKVMTIKVKIRSQAGYDPTNEITGWESLGAEIKQAPQAQQAPAAQPAQEGPELAAQVVPAAPAGQPTQATAAPVANGKKPWEK